MKNSSLNLRVSEELKEKILKASSKLGLDPSSYVRMVLTKELNKEVG